MNDDTHQWENFYGLKNFYPGLYTPEEAWKLRDKTPGGFFSFLMDICYAGGLNNFYIGNINTNGHAATLVDKRGWAVMEVTVNTNGDGGYTVHNWYHHLKKRGSNRYSSNSRNTTYLLRVIKPYLEPLLLSADANMNAQLVNAAQSVIEYLNESTGNAAQIERQVLSAEAAYSALRLMFDPEFTQVQIESGLLFSMKNIYDELYKKFANKKTYADRVKDMFDHPKWMIAITYSYGTYRCMIGQVKIVPVTLHGKFQLVYETEPKLYRDLNHFYTTHPDDEGSIKTGLMFCKVHREKLPDQAKTYDKEGFLPCNSRGVYEDIGAISYCGSYSGPAMSHPHFLLLQK